MRRLLLDMRCVSCALPCIMLVILNSALVIFANKSSNRAINRLNLLVVLLVTAAFFISTPPYFLTIVIYDPSLEYKEIARLLSYISVWINPFIYFAVNPAYIEFTRKKLLFWKHSSLVQQKPSSHIVTNRF